MAKKTRSLLSRVGLAFLVAFLVAIPSGYAFLEWTIQPSFCTNCHLMFPYYRSWENSSHGQHKVSCVDCHYEPGVVETVKGKITALNMVVKYFTGAEGTKPWAEVSDLSCMRSGCHSTRLLAGQVKFAVGRDRPGGSKVSIPFNHTPHLLEMRRSKKLRCTSCHSQIVQGEHLTVTATTCFLCHFKGAREDPKLSDCRTCHGPPDRPIDLGGFVFEHKAYLDRGVSCQSCHPGTTRGTGEVPRHRCNSCHGVIEHLERYGETELIHRKHVTDHKVDCLECHTEITHRLRPRPGTEAADGEAGARTGLDNCDSCHASSHGPSQAFFQGEGGRGAPSTPSAMWLARVDCGGCHVSHPGVRPTSRGVASAKEVACLSCHGPGFEGMMGRWQKAYAEAIKSVGTEVDEALSAVTKAGGSEEIRKGLLDAVHDVGLVKADGSRGVHNPWYARKLLEAAHGKAAEAWHTVDPSRPVPSFPLGPRFPTRMTCAMACHLGIEDQDLRAEGTRFVHSKHLGKAGDCDRCHSTGEFGRSSGPEHGKVLVGPKDCGQCHHPDGGPGPAAERACASCHGEEDRFLRGVRADGSQGDAVMDKVSCTDCHGERPTRPVLEGVKPNCLGCHDGDEKYAATADDWAKDARDWRAEAEARLARVRGPARVKGGPAAGALAEAEAVLRRLRFAVPAHNILLFEEEKEAFDDAASAAEKAAR